MSDGKLEKKARKVRTRKAKQEKMIKWQNENWLKIINTEDGVNFRGRGCKIPPRPVNML